MPPWIKDLIEIIFSLGLFFNAALFVPQAIKLWKTKKAEGLSLTTFAGFNVIQLFIILHAYILHDALLMFGYTLSLITCGFVTVFIIKYRDKPSPPEDK